MLFFKLITGGTVVVYIPSSLESSYIHLADSLKFKFFIYNSIVFWCLRYSGFILYVMLLKKCFLLLWNILVSVVKANQCWFATNGCLHSGNILSHCTLYLILRFDRSYYCQPGKSMYKKSRNIHFH